jgi:hypothetical protein
MICTFLTRNSSLCNLKIIQNFLKQRAADLYQWDISIWMNGIRPAHIDNALISSAGFRPFSDSYFPLYVTTLMDFHNYWMSLPAKSHLILRTMSISSVTSVECHHYTSTVITLEYRSLLRRGVQHAALLTPAYDPPEMFLGRGVQLDSL